MGVVKPGSQWFENWIVKFDRYWSSSPVEWLLDVRRQTNVPVTGLVGGIRGPIVEGITGMSGMSGDIGMSPDYHTHAVGQILEPQPLPHNPQWATLSEDINNIGVVAIDEGSIPGMANLRKKESKPKRRRMIDISP